MSDTKTEVKPKQRERLPRCSDFDDDCYGIGNKTACYMHDPTKGYCPFLTGEVWDWMNIP